MNTNPLQLAIRAFLDECELPRSWEMSVVTNLITDGQVFTVLVDPGAYPRTPTARKALDDNIRADLDYYLAAFGLTNKTITIEEAL